MTRVIFAKYYCSFFLLVMEYQLISWINTFVLVKVLSYKASGEATLCRRGRLTPTALRLPLIVYKFWPLSTPAKKLPDPSGPTAQHAAEAARKFHFADVILAGLYRQQPRLPIWPPLHRSNSFILSLTAPPIRRSNSASCPCPARRHIMHSDGGGVVAPRADQ